MPAHLKALVIIVVLAATMLMLGRRFACDAAIPPDDYRRRALVWLTVTLVAFLSHNYWIFVLVSMPLIAVAGRKDSNRFGLYLFLLFIVPAFRVDIGNLLVGMNHFRWLSLVLLLPAYLSLRTQAGVLPFGRATADKLIIGYMILQVLVRLSNVTLTAAARDMVELGLDVFLPYYVASRGLRSIAGYRDASLSLVMAVLLMCPVAVLELGKSWLLYGGLGDALGLSDTGMGLMLRRGEDLLRAQVTSGQSIVLGYIMVVALGFMVFLRSSFTERRWWWFACATLLAGLGAALARGPWVGAACMLLVLLLTGPQVASKVGKAVLAGAMALPLLLLTPQGQKIIDYLPFIGTVEAQNVEFRARLFSVTVGVIANFPVLGTWGLGYHPDLEQMRGSDGIIDMVNSYLSIALNTGLLGLTVFAAPLVFVIVSLARSLAAQPDKHSESYALGQSLLAVLVGIMVTIATVSSIFAVPLLYWIVIGMGAGYLQLRVAAPVPAAATTAGRPPLPSAARRPAAAGLRRDRPHPGRPS